MAVVYKLNGVGLEVTPRGPAGPSVNSRGIWREGDVYAKNDLVHYNGVTYTCLLGNKDTPPDTDMVDGSSPYWSLYADQGPMGPPPEHRWEGPFLSFRNPDGTWGTSVNLTGPATTPEAHWDADVLVVQTPDGEERSPPLTGPTGLAPEHTFTNGILRFMQPNGAWGPEINLASFVATSAANADNLATINTTVEMGKFSAMSEPPQVLFSPETTSYYWKGRVVTGTLGYFAEYVGGAFVRSSEAYQTEMSGVSFKVGASQPRMQANLAGVKGLLLEGSAVNFLADSGNLASSHWVRSAGLRATATELGPVEGERIWDIREVPEDAGVKEFRTQVSGLQQGKIYTFSAFIGDQSRDVRISVGSGPSVLFKAEGLPEFTSPNVVGLYIEPFGTTLRRASFTFEMPPFTENPEMVATLVNASGDTEYQGQEGSGLKIASFQIENSGSATSPIKSAGSQGIRAADTLTFGSLLWPEGTLAVLLGGLSKLLSGKGVFPVLCLYGADANPLYKVSLVGSMGTLALREEWGSSSADTTIERADGVLLTLQDTGAGVALAVNQNARGPNRLLAGDVAKFSVGTDMVSGLNALVRTVAVIKNADDVPAFIARYI